MARKFMDEVHYEGDWRVSIDDRVIVSEASVDGQAGELRDKPVFTGEEAAAYLNRGFGGVGTNTGAQWAGAQGGVNGQFDAIPKGYVEGQPLTQLAYSFYEKQSDLGEPYFYEFGGQRYLLYPQAAGFSAFTQAQRDAARQALDAWDELVAFEFVEKASGQGDINMMNTTTGPIQAGAFIPYNYSPAGTLPDGNVVESVELAGDLFINPNQASNFQFDEGQYGLNTLIHELGHSLGLEHPGGYNFSADFTATYDNGAEYYQDSRQYSIMSYWDAEETGAAHVNWEFLTYNYNATPMVHDIAAIQRIYGADMTTRTGDTVYGFNNNTGLDVFDFEATPGAVISIWDAGGNDTLDLSGYDTPSIIDLNPGAFSSGGGILLDDIPTLAEINANRAEAGLAPRSQGTYDLYLDLFGNSFTNGLIRDNISIAYNVSIENAVGGKGDDRIIANNVANRIDGGEGFDTLSYSASDKGVKVSLQGGADEGYAKGDTFTSIEALEGSNFNDWLGGSDRNDGLSGLGGDDLLEAGNGNDTLDGGAGNDHLKGDNGIDSLAGGTGNDFLEAGNGDDVLNGGGGNDRLSGGNGADHFLFAEGGNDTIIDFNRGDVIDLTGLGALDASDVTVTRGRVFVDLDGPQDLTILVQGSGVKLSDVLFITAEPGTAAAALMSNEYMIAA